MNLSTAIETTFQQQFEKQLSYTNVIKKHRCCNCNKKLPSILAMNCKTCIGKFCTSCIQPEIHECPNIHEVKSNSKTKLKQDIEKNREGHIPQKITKI